MFNPLNAELSPICHLLALLGAHHILHVSRLTVNEKSDSTVNASDLYLGDVNLAETRAKPMFSLVFLSYCSRTPRL